MSETSKPHSDQVVDQLLATIRYAYVDGPARVQAEANLRSLVEQLEAARKEAREWRLTAETNGDNWHRLNEQFGIARAALEEIRNATSAAGSGEMSVMWAAERARRGLGESSPASESQRMEMRVYDTPPRYAGTMGPDSNQEKKPES